MLPRRILRKNGEHENDTKIRCKEQISSKIKAKTNNIHMSMNNVINWPIYKTNYHVCIFQHLEQQCSTSSIAVRNIYCKLSAHKHVTVYPRCWVRWTEARVKRGSPEAWYARQSDGRFWDPKPRLQGGTLSERATAMGCPRSAGPPLEPRGFATSNLKNNEEW
jgi:hypothetical protein